MIRVFWIAAGIALVLAVLGIAVFPRPDLGNVPGQSLDGWYAQQTVWALILGALMGAGLAWLARRRIRHVPREHARDFASRVGGFGFWTLLGAAVVALIVSSISAVNAVFIPAGPFERFVGLAASGRFLGIGAAAAVTAALVFAIFTRGVPWGGQYALLNPNLLPNLAD